MSARVSASAGRPSQGNRIDDAARWIAGACPDGAERTRASRILVSGAASLPQVWAVAVARALAEAGQKPLLIDTSQGAASLSGLMELPRSPGLAELCQRKVGFDEVIWRDGLSGCHVLPSGRPRTVGGGWGEPGAADRVLRALDASYPMLIVCAETEEAHLLASNLQRQFSAAILVEAGRTGLGRGIRDLFAAFGFPALQVDPLR